MNPHLNLGYCCLNTRLHAQKIFCARTMRLATFTAKGVKYAEEIALQNVGDLMPILRWNQEHNIKLFRISSDLFPLASHPKCLYGLDFAQHLLMEVGSYARSHGHRLTMHPSQHHVLTAKTEAVIHSTVLGLEHQCDILDRMGMDKQSVMVIHGGGVYGDKPDALARLELNIMKLKENVRNRLVLENDEMAYNIEDLLPISQKLKIPIVIDYHHDAIRPSSKPAEFYHKAVFSVWDERGIKPKVHISQSEPGVDMKNVTARRRHGNYIDFLPDALMKMDRPVDVMFEAKMKEESILRFRALFEESAGPVSKPSAQQLPSEPEKEGPVLKKRKGKR